MRGSYYRWLDKEEGVKTMSKNMINCKKNEFVPEKSVCPTVEDVSVHVPHKAGMEFSEEVNKGKMGMRRKIGQLRTYTKCSNNKKEKRMKKIKATSLVILGMLGAFAHASVLSAPVKAAVKGCEKAAAKLGIRVAEKPIVRGGAKLAAVTAEREVAKSATQGTIKTIAKEATAKKILAAGAATTMVVSGHEIADGVQDGIQEAGKGIGEMGKGVGKAAEDNPEVAVAVANSITKSSPTAFVKNLLMTGVLALAGLILWLLWPWFRLFRNICTLAARRKAGTMRDGDVIDVTPVPVCRTESTCRSGFSRLEVLFAASACLVLTILGVWRMAANGDGHEVPDSAPATAAAEVSDDKACAQAKQAERIARRKAAIAKMHAAYADALEQHYRNFLSDIENVGDAQFGIVRMGIPAVVDKFGTFSRCKDLFETIVTDKLKGENETGNSIRRDLEADYYKRLYAARDKVYGCLETFLRNAESAKEAFRLELEDELDTVELPGDDAYKALLEECGERIEQKKEELKCGQIDAGIALALEAVCIRQTVATVAKALGKAAARQSGTMVAGAGAAMADGPLPVGDAIAGVAIIGCTAWSVWDVYKATKILPEELRATLEATTRKCEQQTLDEVKNSGEKAYMAYCAGKPT